MIAASTPPNNNFESLPALESITAKSDAKNSKDSGYLSIRLKAVETAALTLGAQSGLAYESKKINAFLKSHEVHLNQLFDFNQLMLQSGVLPPVIETADNSIHISDGNQVLRLAGRTYRLIQQVRFVTVAPTWRDYLMMAYQKPQLPNKILLPKNEKEQKIWAKNIRLGWQQGQSQAMEIYQINLNRLVRDFNGMLLYKKLLAEGLISPAYVAKKYYGVTGNKKQLYIDDWAWKINKQPEMQLKSHLWNPIVDKNSGNTS